MLHCDDGYRSEVSGVVFKVLVILIGIWCNRIGFCSG